MIVLFGVLGVLSGLLDCVNAISCRHV